jgi:NADH:ubiquinone oxidoreductase subunit 6 (subunit J)
MFWFREIAGWLLVLLGLFLFLVCCALLLGDPPGILEAPFLTAIAIVVFRGGIHLLKVAVASRVCLQAHQRLEGGAGRIPQQGSSRTTASKRPLVRQEM